MDPGGCGVPDFMLMPTSVYIHIPFCTHRCAYCDFNTYAGQDELIPKYVDALCRELRMVGQEAPGDTEVHTVFFGGGTPSLLSAGQVRCVIDAVRRSFHLEDSAEITLEANPGTVGFEGLSEMHAAGVNRLSLGVQSANGEELRLLERTHHFGDVLQAISAGRHAGFDNLNLDLIYGLPGQALRTWQETVRRVLALHPEHISAYCLTLEHGTPFGRWAERGLMVAPDPDLAAEMYEWASTEFLSAGYAQYEISNWAKPGRECRHNLQYWRCEPYLGLGAGAHGYAAGSRYSNVLAIRGYLERLPDGGAGGHGGKDEPRDADAAPATDDVWQFPVSPAAITQTRQTPADEMADFMIMGLRLTREGVKRARFAQRFGLDLYEVFGDRIGILAEQGLLELLGGPNMGQESNPDEEVSGNDGIRLTGRGRLLGNRVFSEFVL